MKHEKRLKLEVFEDEPSCGDWCEGCELCDEDYLDDKYGNRYIRIEHDQGNVYCNCEDCDLSNNFPVV